MIEILSGLLNPIIVIFAASSMMAVGLKYTLSQILAPLRNLREVLKAILANFVLVPLIGYLIIQIIPLAKPLEVGLLIISTAAGAPFLIKLTIAAGRDAGLSTSLLVLLIPLTIIYIPIVVPLTIPEISVSPMAIAAPLVITMLLPLVIGFLIKAYFPQWALYIRPYLSKLSSISLLLLVLILLIVNFKSFIDMLGEGIIVASVLLILSSFVTGYLLGGPGIAEKDVLGLGTAQRNIAAATVTATQGFEDRNTLVVVVLTSLLTLLILFPIAKLLRKREERNYQTDPNAQEGIL